MTGRSYCNAVEAYDCAAPAGFRNARGYAKSPGVMKSELNVCGYCLELVCTPCSSEMEDPFTGKPVRICLNHGEHELADWLRL